MESRLTQLLARYLSKALLALAGMLGVTLAPETVEGAVSAVAALLVAVGLAILDHIIHKRLAVKTAEQVEDAVLSCVADKTLTVRAGTAVLERLADTKVGLPPVPVKHIAPPSAFLLLLLLFPLFLCGCFRRPESVVQAEKENDRLIQRFAVNAEKLNEASLAGFRQEAQARAKTLYSWDQERIETTAKDWILLQADAQGKPPKETIFTSAQLLEFVQKAKTFNQKASADMLSNLDKPEAETAKAREAWKKAMLDLGNALKLRALLEQFYEYGAPMSVIVEAQQFIQAILGGGQPP